MIADIIPTKKLPKSLSILSYAIPHSLKKQVAIGQLVNIPLRNSITTGVICHIKKDKRSPYPLKPIISLPNPKPIFTPAQLKLFISLSAYYRVSASLFIHFNLPKTIKSDWDKLPLIPPARPSTSSKPSYLWWTNPEERNQYYLKTIKATKGQTLIIVPRITDIQILAQSLKLKQSDFIPLHRSLSRQKKFSAWRQAISSTASLFIATRSAVFYPFSNLKTIILDDEHSPDHKQYDMNPRYHVITAAKFLSPAKLILSSPAPSLTSYFELSPQPTKPFPKRNMLLSDLNNEITKKNFSFISEHLFNQIKHSLKAKKSVFLLVNKKGESSSTSCRDCHFTFSCPTCALPLIKTTNHQLICYYCDYAEKLPPFCPSCSGPNFHSTGLGIQKVETNLSKLFPKNRIIRLDKDSPTNKIKAQQPTIYLGTLFALDKIPWQKINTLGLVNADNLWQHAEFMAAQRAYSLIIQLLTLSPKNATLVIQTFTPEHYLIRSITGNKPSIFYSQELKFSQQFNYPPFTHLVKISTLGKSQATAQKSAEKICAKISASSKKISLTPPLPILRKKIRGKYKFNLILKAPDLKELDSIIKFIPHDALIDIDPQTLLD